MINISELLITPFAFTDRSRSNPGKTATAPQVACKVEAVQSIQPNFPSLSLAYSDFLERPNLNQERYMWKVITNNLESRIRALF